MQILTGATVIGYRANGSPIFWIGGGSGQAGTGEGGDGGAGSGGSGDNGTGDGGQGAQGEGKGKKDGEGGTEGATGSDGKPFDAERAQRTIQSLRDDNKTFKSELKKLQDSQQERDKALAKALGLQDEQPSPEKLQQELSGRDNRISTLESDNAKLRMQIEIVKKGFAKNADVDVMWALLQTTGSLDKLDMTAEDFGEKVDLLLDDMLSRHPQIKRSGIASRDAGERGSGPATGSVNDMIRSAAGRR